MKKLWIVGLAMLLAVWPGWAAVYQYTQIQEQLKQSFPRAQWGLYDKEYQDMPHDVFVGAFTIEFRAYLARRGIHATTPGFGAKQYAQLCKTQLDLWLKKHYKRKHQMASAVLVADASAVAASPGTPTGWLLLALDGRWYVYNAIENTLTPLETFADGGRVAAVQF